MNNKTNSYENLLKDFLNKYCIHDFCLCAGQEKDEKVNLMSSSRTHRLREEVKQAQPLPVMVSNNAQKIELPSLKMLDSEESSIIRIPISGEIQKEQIGASKNTKIVQKAAKKRQKRIEREFTESHARKDVIYKAILRFLKRHLEARFRSSESENKSKNNHSKKPKLSLERVKKFLWREFEEEPSDDLASIFIAVIDTNSYYSNLSRNYEEFRETFSKVISKFNAKLLSKCFENREFAKIFSNFWAHEDSYSQLQASIRNRK